MSIIKTEFESEKQMALFFDEFLQRFRNAHLIKDFTEFEGVWGIPDYLIIAGEADTQIIITIELKLKNWKRAMQQAYRYKGFSDFAFVIIDQAHSKSALQNIELFRQYNIGLCSFDKNKSIIIHCVPDYEPPFSLSHFDRLIKKLSKNEINIPAQRNTNSRPISEFFDRFVPSDLSVAS